MDNKRSSSALGATKKKPRIVIARSRASTSSNSERRIPTRIDSRATTDNETSEPSQFAIDSSVVASESSSGSIAMHEMPSVIDLSGANRRLATNDEIMLMDKLNVPYREGAVFLMMPSPGEENNSKQPSQIDDSTKQSGTRYVTPGEKNYARPPPQIEDTTKQSVVPVTATTDVQQTLPDGQNKPKSRFQGRYESSVFCRICHEVGSSDLFISPCDCKGSLSLVHKHCLERWLAESNSSLCELCGYEYLTRRLPKHNALGSVFAWLLASGNGRERRLLLWDLFSLTLLVPLALLGTSLGMKVLSKDVVGTMTGIVLAYTRFLQMAMVTATVTLDAGIMTWALIRIQYHFLHWFNWYNRNCKVILLGYPESHQTAPAVQQVSSATVREIQF